MLTVYVTMGLPGSGKSRWAREKLAENPNGIKRICKDDLRAMVDDSKWSGDAEKFILKARDALINLALESKKHVIIDDTNLHHKHLARIDEIASTHGARVEIVDFTDVPIEICIERDLKRPNSVGEQIIKKMHRQFLAHNGSLQTVKPLVRDPNLPDAIICDIDGTLALHNGRSPYEFEKCGEDLCNESVKYILNRTHGDGWTKILFVSGREDKHREVTLSWLGKHLSFYGFELFMRPTGDKRRDDIIKKEIYENEIKGKYNILFSIDDRQRTVDAWRSLGLTCLQVDRGDF